MAPSPVEQASVWRINGLLRSGLAKIGVLVSFFFSIWKASSAWSVHANDASCLKVALIGAAILEKSLTKDQ